MRRYRNIKVYSWNAKIAYITGLMASDGCLYNDFRHLNLTSAEPEMLLNFKTILGLRCDIKSKPNGFGGIGYYLQFSDVALYDFLYNAGIKPAKSKTLGPITVPDRYYADFLRGYFDGDGSIYGFWDTRWKNSLMYYTEFCSASPAFLEWLNIQNQRLADTKIVRIQKTTRASVVSYAKSDSKLLFQFMYYSNDVTFLERKLRKFVDFFNQDPYCDSDVLREWRNW